MSPVPTRWRTTFEDQLTDAAQRADSAGAHAARGEGQRTLQEAYPAGVAAATVRVWLEHPPWTTPLAPADLQRRTREAFPTLFATIASLELKDALNSPWQIDAVRPYLAEARTFVAGVRERLAQWLAQD